MDKTKLLAELIYCPDCVSALDERLRCISCGRSFAPDSDGIVSAMPRSMMVGQRKKEEIESAIGVEGVGDRGSNVVLYEEAFHDEQAHYYDELFADPLPLAAYYKHLVQDQIYSEVRDRRVLIDLCCGTGKSSLPLIENGVPVVGIDVSREMLRAYKRKCDHKGLADVLLIHGDASNPPLRSQSCGAIAMIGGLHHIRDQAGSIASCVQALAPNGLLILHEPLKSGKTHPASVFLENLYAVLDLRRLWRAVRRRLGFQPHAAPAITGSQEMLDFTPFEMPFSSPSDLTALLPGNVQVVTMRSQGCLCFREFPSTFQNWIGRLLAPIVVHIDDALSAKNKDWSGDAIFAVMRKTART
jgi:SAM-dependent methyltransferase